MSIMSFYISFKVKHQDRKTHQSGRSICLTTYAINTHMDLVVQFYICIDKFPMGRGTGLLFCF